SLTDSVTISEPDVLALSSTTSDVLCYGGNTGEATIQPTGGTPAYSYNWSPSGGSDSTATGLAIGTYSVIVNDIKGCTDSILIMINQPDSLSSSLNQTNVSCNGGNDGELIVTPNGGTAPFSFAWSNSDNDSIAENL
ncbi:hypothetical protein FRY74_12805, partial [Vicingus serpentipes]